MSPPARGRGLKLLQSYKGSCAAPSPPARGRGLKHVLNITIVLGRRVAPRAGAWIETGRTATMLAVWQSPPARGRGLKHSRTPPKYDCNMSPPARGRGLKRTVYLLPLGDLGRPPRGGVD